MNNLDSALISLQTIGVNNKHENVKGEDECYKKMFKLKVINDIIYSYIPQVVTGVNFSKDFDNAKSYLIISNWTERVDLTLIAYSMLAEISSNYTSMNTPEMTLLRNCNVIDTFKEINYFNWTIQRNGLLIKYADPNSPIYPALMDTALDQNPNSLEFASDEIKNDLKKVLAVVQKDGKALRFASEDLRANKEIVLAAVRQHGWAIAYSSKELRGDKDVALEAVKQRPSSIQYIDEQLLGDIDIWKETVKGNGLLLKLKSAEPMLNNRDVITEAVHQNGMALEFASVELRNEFNIVLEAVKNDGMALQFASKEMRSNLIIRNAAYHQNPASQEFAIDPEEEERKARIEAEANKKREAEEIERNEQEAKRASERGSVKRTNNFTLSRIIENHRERQLQNIKMARWERIRRKRKNLGVPLQKLSKIR